MPGDKLLPRGVDILAAYLEEVSLLAEGHDAVELFCRISCRHEGDGVESVLLYYVKNVVKVVVLELLRLLVSGDGASDIAEVGICGNSAEASDHIGVLLNRGELVGCRDVYLFDKVALECAENVVLVELRRVLSVKDICLRLSGDGDAHHVLHEGNDLCRLGVSCGYLLCKSEQQVSLRNRRDRQREHVAVEINRYAEASGKAVDVFCHAAVSDVPLCPERREEPVYLFDIVVGNAVHDDICDRKLVGVVQASAAELCCRHIDAALGTDSYGKPDYSACLKEFTRSGCRIVIDYSCRGKTAHIRGVYGIGRCIGRKRVAGVYVIVYIVRPRHFRQGHIFKIFRFH